MKPGGLGEHPSGMVKARAALGVGVVALVWAVAWFAVMHAPPAGEATIAIAAAIDFSATASLALYFIAVRPGHLPRWTLGVTLTIGLAMGKVTLATTADATTAVMAVGAAFELGVIAWLAIRGRRAYRAYRVSRAAGAQVLDALTEAFLAAKLPARVAGMMATELSLVATLVTGWRKPAPGAFTVHRNSGWSLYAGVLIFLTLVETSAVHVVLMTYASATAAWIVSALSVYTALWFVGDVLALRQGGVILRAAELELRIGVRWRGRIPWRLIESIEPFDSYPKGIGSPDSSLAHPKGTGSPDSSLAHPKGTGSPDSSLAHHAVTNLSILGANVILNLREPVRIVGLLGRKRDATAIALSIDDREAFVAAVESAIRPGAGIERDEHRA
jgi:hypothetical protein